MADLHKYNVILINSEVINLSQILIKKYDVKGLRALDGMQLASVCILKDVIDIAITDDKLLNDFFISENIKIPSIL